MTYLIFRQHPCMCIRLSDDAVDSEDESDVDSDASVSDDSDDMLALVLDLNVLFSFAEWEDGRTYTLPPDYFARRLRPLIRIADFEGDHLSTTTARQTFRFHASSLRILVDQLRFRNTRLDNGSFVEAEELLLVLLARLACTSTNHNLALSLNVDPSRLSRVFKAALSYVHRNFAFPLLRGRDVYKYAAHMFDDWKGHCFRKMNAVELAVPEYFQDTTLLLDTFLIRIARPRTTVGGYRYRSRRVQQGLPRDQQRQWWGFYRKMHACKLQSIVSPDLMFLSLRGTFVSKRHNITVLRLSGDAVQFARASQTLGGRSIHTIAADKGYTNCMALPVTGMYKKPMTRQQRIDNSIVATVRVAVEWAHQKLHNNWRYIDLSNAMKINSIQLDKIILVMGFFTNVHTCLYGSEGCVYFSTSENPLHPPALDEYLERRQPFVREER